jgi:hypothetical protein
MGHGSKVTEGGFVSPFCHHFYGPSHFVDSLNLANRTESLLGRAHYACILSRARES